MNVCIDTQVDCIVLVYWTLHNHVCRLIHSTTLHLLSFIVAVVVVMVVVVVVVVAVVVVVVFVDVVVDGVNN